MDFDEWDKQQIEKERAAIVASVIAGANKAWTLPLNMDYTETGAIYHADRHYGGERHDDLDHEARVRAGKGPLSQDAIVYMAAPRDVKLEALKLTSATATASLPVAVSAGTGLVIRILVPEGTVVEAIPSPEGETPAEEVILPEGASLRVFAEVKKLRGATVLDAILVG